MFILQVALHMSGEVKCPQEQVLLIFNNGAQHFCFDAPKECANLTDIKCDAKIQEAYKVYCSSSETMTKQEPHNEVYTHTYSCVKKHKEEL